MANFNPVQMLANSGGYSSTWYSSFELQDNFRKWAASVGMPKAECEACIKEAQGKGYNHLYASLCVARQQYEQKHLI